MGSDVVGTAILAGSGEDRGHMLNDDGAAAAEAAGRDSSLDAQRTGVAAADETMALNAAAKGSVDHRGGPLAGGSLGGAGTATSGQGGGRMSSEGQLGSLGAIDEKAAERSEKGASFEVVGVAGIRLPRPVRDIALARQTAPMATECVANQLHVTWPAPRILASGKQGNVEAYYGCASMSSFLLWISLQATSSIADGRQASLPCVSSAGSRYGAAGSGAGAAQSGESLSDLAAMGLVTRDTRAGAAGVWLHSVKIVSPCFAIRPREEQPMCTPRSAALMPLQF